MRSVARSFSPPLAHSVSGPDSGGSGPRGFITSLASDLSFRFQVLDREAVLPSISLRDTPSFGFGSGIDGGKHVFGYMVALASHEPARSASVSIVDSPVRRTPQRIFGCLIR